MKRSTKAALLSGLIFPGIGHLVLKRYLRGSILMLSALTAFSVIVTIAFERALTIVDKISVGDIPIDEVAIAEAVSNSSGGASGFAENAALVVLGACWLFGIIDSYRLGVAQQEQELRKAASDRKQPLGR